MNDPNPEVKDGNWDNIVKFLAQANSLKQSPSIHEIESTNSRFLANFDNNFNTNDIKTEMISYLAPFTQQYYLETSLKERPCLTGSVMSTTKDFLVYADTLNILKLVSLHNLKVTSELKLHEGNIIEICAYNEHKTSVPNPISQLFKEKRINLFGSIDDEGLLLVWYSVFFDSNETILQKTLMSTKLTEKNKNVRMKFKNPYLFLTFSNNELSIWSLSQNHYDLISKSSNEEEKQISVEIPGPSKYITQVLSNHIKDADFSQKNDLIYVCLDTNSLVILNVEMLDVIKHFEPYQGNPQDSLVQVLSYMNIFKSKETELSLNKENLPNNFGLKDIFVTVSNKLEIKVWDLSEIDSKERNFGCIESIKPRNFELNQESPKENFVVEFDFTRNFLFVLVRHKEENILFIYHIDKRFYSYNEEFMKNLNGTRFFDYFKEFKLQDRPIYQIQVINLYEEEYKLYFHTEENVSVTANTINEIQKEDNPQDQIHNYDICDSKTYFAIFCLYYDYFNINLTTSEAVYPLYLVEDLDKIEKNEKDQNPNQDKNHEEIKENANDEIKNVISNPIPDFLRDMQNNLKTDDTLKKHEEIVITEDKKDQNLKKITEEFLSKTLIKTQDPSPPIFHQDLGGNQNPFSSPYQNSQISNNQFTNNQFPNNQFPNNQFPNNQFPNNQFSNNQFSNNQFPNNSFQNTMFTPNIINNPVKSNNPIFVPQANFGNNNNNNNNNKKDASRKKKPKPKQIRPEPKYVVVGNSSHQNRNDRKLSDKEVKSPTLSMENTHNINNNTSNNMMVDEKNNDANVNNNKNNITNNNNNNNNNNNAVINIPTQSEKSVQKDQKDKKENNSLQQSSSSNQNEDINNRNLFDRLQSILENKLDRIKDDLEKTIDKKLDLMKSNKIIEESSKSSNYNDMVNLPKDLQMNFSKMFSDQFEKSVTPCFEKYLQKIFEQVNNTFEKGQKFFIEKVNLEQIKSQHIKDSLQDALKIFMQMSSSLTESLNNNFKNNNKMELFYMDKQTQINKMIENVTEIIRKEREVQDKIIEIEKNFQNVLIQWKDIANSNLNSNKNSNQTMEDEMKEKELKEKEFREKELKEKESAINYSNNIDYMNYLNRMYNYPASSNNQNIMPLSNNYDPKTQTQQQFVQSINPNSYANNPNYQNFVTGYPQNPQGNIMSQSMPFIGNNNVNMNPMNLMMNDAVNNNNNMNNQNPINNLNKPAYNPYPVQNQNREPFKYTSELSSEQQKIQEMNAYVFNNLARLQVPISYPPNLNNYPQMIDKNQQNPTQTTNKSAPIQNIQGNITFPINYPLQNPNNQIQQNPQNQNFQENQKTLNLPSFHLGLMPFFNNEVGIAPGMGMNTQNQNNIPNQQGNNLNKQKQEN